LTAPLAIATSRLRLRWLTASDADFVLRLVNDAEWLRFIGDKGVQDIDGARRYIETSPVAMYREFGFGLNRVAIGDSDRAIGICGLLQRAALNAPDLGFALLPAWRGQGYALEAAQAVLEHARETLALPRVLAIVDAQNRASIGLLSRLGFERSGEHSDAPGSRPLDLYALDLNLAGPAARADRELRSPPC
jgi:[ribosomal protein S5]-alanine N-acetyltransferase